MWEGMCVRRQEYERCRGKNLVRPKSSGPRRRRRLYIRGYADVQGVGQMASLGGEPNKMRRATADQRSSVDQKGQQRAREQWEGKGKWGVDLEISQLGKQARSGGRGSGVGYMRGDGRYDEMEISATCFRSGEGGVR